MFLFKSFNDSLIYIRKNRFTVIIVLFSYCMGLLIGLFNPVGSGLSGNKIDFSLQNGYGLIANILLNNIKVAVTMILGGLMFLGVLTVVILFLNGLILGSAIYYTYTINPNLIYITLLPQGIIEVPSFLLAGFVGIRLPFEFYKYLIYEKPKLKNNILELLHITFYIFLLIFIAALVESFLVPFILKNMIINIGG